MIGDFGRDLISDLPQSIVESILTRLPIRDAVRTSILSSNWRYRWSSITELVFDDECGKVDKDGALFENSLVRFVTHALLLHQGPIYKFELRTPLLQLQLTLVVDQWLLFLSRKNVKELVIGLGEWYKVPSCLFNFNTLISLELVNCEINPPSSFKGFLNLKSLSLNQVSVSQESIESLISSCPILESLKICYFDDDYSLKINAPNLKYLCLEGEFTNIFLEHSPLLISLSVAIYMNDDVEEELKENFIKFLGGVPLLEKLAGRIYFTKYLSIGNNPGVLPVTYNKLKIIELHEVSFEDTKEVLVVLRLITSAPNLTELHISGSSNTSTTIEASCLDFWKEECRRSCRFKQLKIAKMTEMSGIPNEMEFIKFLLANSPKLKQMRIDPSVDVIDKYNMLIELIRFPRASAQAEIIFAQD